MMNQNNMRTVGLFGLPISDVTMAETVDRIADAIENRTSFHIATANLDFARNARRHSFLHQVICDCNMVLPDGAPMLWAARLFRKPLKERVTGVDLVPELARLSAERGYTIFLLGSEAESATLAIAKLEQMHPGVKIVGRYHPEVAALEHMDDEEMLRRIHEAKSDILLVAFGNPKQELWIDRNRERLGVPVAIGIGGSMDMIGGTLRRAPRFIQKLQLEWAFRMLQEPQRLLPRYAGDLKALLRHLPMELMAMYRQPESLGAWPMDVSFEDGVRVIHMASALTAPACDEMMEEIHSAIYLGQRVVLDMTLTQRLEADGVGALLEARRNMIAAHLPLWMGNVSAPVRKVLEAGGLVQHLRLAPTVLDAVRLSGLPERRKRPVPTTGLQRLAEILRGQPAAADRRARTQPMVAGARDRRANPTPAGVTTISTPIVARGRAPMSASSSHVPVAGRKVPPSAAARLDGALLHMPKLLPSSAHVAEQWNQRSAASGS